jgi:thioredoxin-dependent peroxiredoxin
VRPRARRLEPGFHAPDFTLPNQNGELTQLSSLRGRRVVLYFYPEADTPGCTTQACGVRDRAAEYRTVDAIVLGVSPDPPNKLRAFADKYRLQFTLLSDEDHSVAERYGVRVKRLIYRRRDTGRERSTFLIGPDGWIEHVFRNVDPADHDELVLGALVA